MKRRMNYNLIVGIIALVLIIFAIAIIGYFVSKPKEMVLQGEAEANEYRISGKVPGRIEEMYVREGQTVHKGDTVAYIESPEVRAKQMQVGAMRDAAVAQRNKAINGARDEQITGAYELWQQALVQEDVMRKSYTRVDNLYQQKVVSAQKHDEVKAQYDAACAASKAAKSQYDMAVNGARQEDKAAASAVVRQAQGAMAEVRGYLNELYLTAPADGVISAIYPKVGELVGQGAPVMTLTDLSDMWFTFNIREDYLQSMQVGDKLRLTIPALNGKECDATVSYIAVRESYATWKATKETGQYDAKTFEVRAVPTQKVPGLRPGMTVIIKR